MVEKRGSTVYIGSGLCSDLDNYLGMNPERLYLVEPNPQLKDDLEEICALHSSVEHLAYGVTPQGGLQKLNVFNFFDLSSFSEPKELHDIYPNIALESVVEVQTLTPVDLMARLALPEDMLHHLVVEATGIEYDLIKAFLASGAYEYFAKLCFRIPTRNLFKDSQSLSQIDAILRAAGYCADHELLDDNADWHLRSYSFDRQAFITANLIGENEALKAEMAQHHQSFTQEANELRAERDQARADLVEAQETNQTLLTEAKNAKAKFELEANELRAERDQARSDLVEAQEANQTLLTEAKNAKAKFELEANELRAERDQARADLVEAQEANQALRTEVEKTKAKLKQETDRLNEKLTMSLRVQTRLLSNYEDLQLEFDALQTKNRERSSLISSLLDELKISLHNVSPSPPSTEPKRRSKDSKQ